MEIQKIFSEIDTDEKLYSVLMNEEELALFSEIQKEFNSKAAKALNNKYLMGVLAKRGIPVYESKSFKTVEVDPREWKALARGINRRRVTNESTRYRDSFNEIINEKVSAKSASRIFPGYNSNKKFNKSRYLTEYDHGDPSSAIISGDDKCIKKYVLKKLGRKIG